MGDWKGRCKLPGRQTDGRIVVTTIVGAPDPSDGDPEPGSRVDRPLGLYKCERSRRFDIVWINGSQDGISDNEIDRFGESFPIRGMPNQKFRIAGAPSK